MIAGSSAAVSATICFSLISRLNGQITALAGGTARAVSHLLKRYYGSLHQHQTTAPWQSQMLDFDGLNAVIETPELLRLGQRYAG